MDSEQLKAFCSTDYVVDAPEGQFLLKVDERSVMLADLLRSRGAACAALITACNPRGQQQDGVENRTAQASLKRDLEALGHAFIHGRNLDQSGYWPVEDSFLVLDMDRQAARALAARYNQLAFLWMDVSTSVPRLVEAAAPC